MSLQYGRKQASPKHPYEQQQLDFQTQSFCQHDHAFVTSFDLSFLPNISLSFDN